MSASRFDKRDVSFKSAIMFARPLNTLERLLPVLFIGIVVMRLVLAGMTGLGDDEAYYWDWTRQLQLSYFDHPPMIAWMIHLSTAVLGDTAFAVRLPAILCNSMATVFLMLFATEMFSWRTALVAGALHMLVPIFALGGMMAVPDAPMALGWSFMMWLGWRMASTAEGGTFMGDSERVSLGSWMLMGLAIGFAFLSKYTAVMAAVSLLMFFFFKPVLRRNLMTSGFSASLLVAFICTLPVVFWNMKHGFPSFAFHLNDRHSGGGGADFNRWFQFWASQVVFLSPVIFVMNHIALGVAFLRGRDSRWRYLFWMAFPTLALFSIQSLFSEFKPHWPAPAHFALMIASARLFEEGFGGREEFQQSARRKIVGWLAVGFILPLFVLFHAALIQPVIPRLAARLAPGANWDPKFDPTNDLVGWDQLARHLKALRADRIANETGDPIFASWRYQLVSQMSFALGEEVWRLSPTRDHYTFTQPPERWKTVAGRPVIFVSDNRYHRDPNSDVDFSRLYSMCAELEPVYVQREGIHARSFRLWECR